MSWNELLIFPGESKAIGVLQTSRK